MKTNANESNLKIFILSPNLGRDLDVNCILRYLASLHLDRLSGGGDEVDDHVCQMPGLRLLQHRPDKLVYDFHPLKCLTKLILGEV